MQHLVLTLQQSQSFQVLSAVQQLVSVAVERVPSATDCKLSVINGEFYFTTVYEQDGR